MKSARPVVERGLPDAAALAAFTDVDPLMARVFVTRGVMSPEELDYGLSRLAPVSKLRNVEAAVDLLLEKRDGKITIVGDFDVDGATSTALVIRCLRAFGFADVDYLVPNRFEFGYGLTPEIVRIAADRKPGLLITVDNGISSISGVAEARGRGIPVLVTDHHLPGAELPDADVIVNPNAGDDSFPSPNLAGVGVAFYLMAALGRAVESGGLSGASRIPSRFLDLVALGTVADVVTLDYNNRILVDQGLRRIRAGKTVPGIEALLRQSGRELARTVSADLGFVVGPRINAAGRLEDISIGIECLLTDDDGAAMQHAAILDSINRDRRQIESDMRDQAFAYVDGMNERDLPPCVCVYEESWHQGVVGLVASRVRERCHRPAIAFAAESGDRLKGSVRSVPGVHARDLLEAVHGVDQDLIIKFGGHAMAAGLTIEAVKYDAFRQLVAEQVQRLYPDADFSGAIVSDGPLPESSLNLGYARTLRDAGPWGAGFPEPLWSGDFEVVEQRTVGEKHLKMRVRPADGENTIDAIAFNQAGLPLRGLVRLVYRLDVNEYRGIQSPQQSITDLTERTDALRRYL
jgi:single-stranded-DNA-specific exonuclease